MTPALVQGVETDETRYRAAWTVGLGRALFVTLGVVLAAPVIAAMFAEPRAVPVLRVLAIRPTLDALASIKVAGLTRELRFRPLAILRLTQALVNAACSLALAGPLGVWALVAGTLAGSATFALLSYVLAPYRPRLCLERAVVQSLVRFGRWVFLSSVIVMAGSYALRVVVSRQLGAAELGLDFLGAELGFLPVEAAREIVGAVAFPLFARLQLDIDQATRTFRTMLTGVFALLCPVCVLLIVLAPALTDEVLGARWTGTAPVIQVLALSSLIGLLGEVAGPVLEGFGQPYKVTALEAIQSALIIGIVWYLADRFGLVGAAWAWLPAIVVSQFLCAAFLRRLLRRPFAGLGAPMLAIVLATGVGSILALAICRITPGLVGLVLSALSAVVVIAALLWISDRSLGLGLGRDLGRTFPWVSRLIRDSRGDGTARDAHKVVSK